MTTRQIQVLIVDDSKVTRDLLSYIVESDPQLKVLDTAENGEEALEILKKKKPDVVITDIVMPKMDGFKLTRSIMSSNPIPIIVVSGIYKPEEVKRGFQAIEAGALAILEKPKGIGDKQYVDTARFVIQTIKALAEVKFDVGGNINVKPQPALAKMISPSINIPPKGEKIAELLPIKSIGIGASIGGPQAIQTILSSLPLHFPVPILVVQHISSGFAQGLVNWLKESTPLDISIAQNKEIAMPGHVYIAPDKFHMEITKDNFIRLIPDPDPRGEIPPSIGRLFQSMARDHGAQCIGILLTGAGKDGAQELLTLKEKGALTIAQDEKTSVKFDLPHEAIRLGAAKHILPLSKISPFIETVVLAKMEPISKQIKP